MSVVYISPASARCYIEKKVLAENLPAKVLNNQNLKLRGFITVRLCGIEPQLYHKTDIIRLQTAKVSGALIK